MKARGPRQQKIEARKTYLHVHKRIIIMPAIYEGGLLTDEMNPRGIHFR